MDKTKEAQENCSFNLACKPSSPNFQGLFGSTSFALTFRILAQILFQLQPCAEVAIKLQTNASCLLYHKESYTDSK